ncbi:hypothetical protein QL285_017807 [Trifolium repens]|nr:hypothetical protein QL285_017807 [Trifolium repens]
MPFTVFDESNLKRAVARQHVVVSISVGHKFLGYREGIYKDEDLVILVARRIRYWSWAMVHWMVKTFG